MRETKAFFNIQSFAASYTHFKFTKNVYFSAVTIFFFPISGHILTTHNFNRFVSLEYIYTCGVVCVCNMLKWYSSAYMEYGYEFEYIQVDIRLDVLENSIASIELSTDKTNNLWTWICIAAVVVFFSFSITKTWNYVKVGVRYGKSNITWLK